MREGGDGTRSSRPPPPPHPPTPHPTPAATEGAPAGALALLPTHSRPTAGSSAVRRGGDACVRRPELCEDHLLNCQVLHPFYLLLLTCKLSQHSSFKTFTLFYIVKTIRADYRIFVPLNVYS